MKKNLKNSLSDVLKNLNKQNKSVRIRKKHGGLHDFPASRECYVAMTEAVRNALYELPGGSKLLHVPTLVCAALYFIALLYTLARQDARFMRALLVPAACFLLATLLRPMIDRQRPYDRFDAPPVGRYERGKGKSMPSRHAASATAIAGAVVFVFPVWPVAVLMVLLAMTIAVLRVVSGQHYAGDVLAALAMSVFLSGLGYTL